jgi:hypothetical protein
MNYIKFHPSRTHFSHNLPIPTATIPQLPSEKRADNCTPRRPSRPPQSTPDLLLLPCLVSGARPAAPSCLASGGPVDPPPATRRSYCSPVPATSRRRAASISNFTEARGRRRSPRWEYNRTRLHSTLATKDDMISYEYNRKSCIL